MKKKVLFIFLFLLVSSLFFVSAENQTAQTDISTKAYACLDSKTADCSTLSLEEKIFSMLAIGKCKTELNADKDTADCWPKGQCSIKTTAQAILALRSGTKNSEDWLVSKTITFTGVDWYLQVESNDDTSCSADYAGASHSFSIASKVISGDAGECLTVSSDGYWLLISPDCFGTDIKISCEKSFSTNLFYKKPTSATFYVSGSTHSASGAGSTTEKVNSLCFGEGTTCDYEGSLWATLILNYKKGNVSAYLPYLVAMADENQQYLPESFLYTLTNNFKISLLTKQVGGQYWQASSDKYYDTALALLPFQSQDLTEKTNTKNWLKDVQGGDGCWEGGTRNTAFLLYSLWPKPISGEEIPSSSDCVASGFFCRSSISCLDDSGSILDNYGKSCFGTDICCNKEEQLQSCSDQQGELCESNQQCLGGTEVDSLDTNSGKFCCVGGICGIQEATQCALNGGACRVTCLDNEQLSSSYGCSGSDICCVAKKTSYVWLIVLLVILIILVVLGIVYKKQLRELFLKFKNWLQTKFKKGKGKPPVQQQRPTTLIPPGRLPSTIPSTRVPPGAVQRRVITTTTTKPLPPKPKSDFDDVLKKLREIGK
jgi:hypothetical protein